MGLFDDIPAAPKAGGGLFDDLPDAARPAQPADGPRASFARPMIGTADASRAPQEEPSVGQQLLQGRFDSEAAVAQRASPIVRDRQGNYIRKPIGEIEEFDFGPAIRKADGSYLAFNPTSDVMLRDPATNKRIAFERHPDHDNNSRAEGVGRTLLEGFMAGPVSRLASSGAIPMATQRGRALGFPVSAKTAQMGERVEDAAAFGELGMEPFAPAFRSKGAARIARTVEEMPVVGGLVKGPKTEAEMKLADTHAGIAAELGAAQTDEAAGRVLQGGLDRFRTAGVREIEPGVLAERGIEARAPVQPAETLSQGARRSAENAGPIRAELGGGVAETVRGVEVPAARPLNQTILARRGVEDMSEAELAALIRSPAAETSFGVRQEALYERAHRKVPVLFKENEARNPNLIATPNAGQVAGGLRRMEEAARVRGGALDGRFGQLIRDLENQRSNFTLNSLKAAKTEIGRALASLGEYDARLDRTQLKGLYSAISRDYEAGLQTVANRAYESTKLPRTSPAYVAPDTARAADQALREMRVADRYTRLSMERMDRFTNLLNAKSPEAAMRGLATRVREGTIDRGTVRAVSDALRPEEREAVLGYLVANMGKGRPGAQEAETIWNVSHFATDWNRNKVALRLLAKDTDPAIVRKLEALANNVAERMKYYETTKNFSGSAYAGIPFAGIASGAAGGLPGMVLTTLGLAGGSAVLGKFLTTPRYLDWMIKAGNTGEIPRAVGPQVGGTRVPALLATLERIAANDNQLGPAIREAVTRLRTQATDPTNVDADGGGDGNDALYAQEQPGEDRQEYSDAPLHGGVDSTTAGNPSSTQGQPRTISVPNYTLGGRRMEGRRPATVQEQTMLENPLAQMGRDAGAFASSAVDAAAFGVPGTVMGYVAPNALASVRDNEALSNAGVPFAGMAAGASVAPVNRLAQGLSWLFGRGSQAVRAAPAVSLPTLAAGGVLATSSDTGETQSRGQATDETRALQQKLRDAGFYSGPIDGITGSATQAARDKFEAAEQAKGAQTIERLRVEAEQAKSAAEKQRAEAAIAETQRQQAAAVEETRRRTEGEDRLKQMEQDIPIARRILREYGPSVGYAAGIGLGLFSKWGVNKAYNARSVAGAERANALLAEEGGDMASRVGRVNQFWGEGQQAGIRAGGAEVPFVAAPGSKPPFRSNPNAPSSGDLYQTGRFADPVTDTTVAGLFAAEAAGSYAGLQEAQTELSSARQSAEGDPSEMNLRRLQAALDNAAIFQTAFNAGRLGGPVYLGLGGKMQRAPTRPDVNLADAERLRIEQYLNQRAGRAQSRPAQEGNPRSSAEGPSTPEPSPTDRYPSQPSPLRERETRGTSPRRPRSDQTTVSSDDLPEGHTYIRRGKGSKIQGPDGKWTTMPENTPGGRSVQIDDTRPYGRNKLDDDY